MPRSPLADTRLPRAALAVAALAVCWGGCSSPSASESVVKTGRVAKAAEPVPAPTERTWPQTERSERDPFRSLFDIDPPTAGDNPLTQGPVGSLKLVGVLVDTATPLALFEDAEGRGHATRIGDLLGNRGGRIVSISHTGVIVEERLRDPIGGVRRDLTELTL